MPRLRQMLGRLIGRGRQRRRPAPDPPRVDYSYAVYWTKQVRQWDPEQRHKIAAALADTLAEPSFEANAYRRRYAVAGLDGLPHAGASLLALQKVLRAFEAE